MNRERFQKFQELLQKKKIDATLLSNPFSVQFFSGFSSSNAFFLITPKKNIFLTDHRYLESAKKFFQLPINKGNLEDFPKITVQEIPKTEKWKDFFAKKNIQKVGTEITKLTVARYKSWKKYFKIQCKDVSEDIEKIRTQKTEGEIQKIRHVAKIADKALQTAIKKIYEGITEKELAWEIEKAGRELGAEKLSFDTIVAFGEHGAIPHHSPTEKKLQKNTPILIDWGFIKDGFCSDCTRCFFYGTPTKQWKEIYEAVLSAQKIGQKEILPGKKLSSPDEAIKKIYIEKKAKMLHSFGHGVGVEVHEYPSVSQKAKGKFLENMIVTAEPGMYFSGKFGIRIEDLGIVRKEKYETLTKFSKKIEDAILEITH